jgi:uncharacterized protein YheU (UPF0270 family)
MNNMEKPLDSKRPPIEIPLDSLSQEALSGVIDNFIQREGTDYGAHEVDHAVKVQQILRQLHQGHVKIAFDYESETVSIVTLGEWKRFTKGLI